MWLASKGAGDGGTQEEAVGDGTQEEAVGAVSGPW